MNLPRRILYRLWDHSDLFLQRFDPEVKARRHEPVEAIRFQVWRDGEWQTLESKK